MRGSRLNLSTRPFPAYLAVNLGLTAILVILIAVSVWQGFSYVRYIKMADGIHSDERTAREDAAALKDKASHWQSRLDRPDAAAKLTEIDYLNNLIARKNFSWTRVFAVLEQIIPESVHLTSLCPDVAEDGKLLLHIDVRGRSIVDVSDLIDLLEKSDVFENVVPHVEEKKDVAAKGDVDVALTMIYVPEREIQ